jgi:CheY-like chemotaxis protein
MTTILVVDDEPAIREAVAEVLEDAGYRCVCARNGEEGLACLEETDPDLVLLDVMMPVLDGREMLRRLRATPRFKETPVILMSAGLLPGGEMPPGHTAFLKKPFSLDALLALVGRVAGGREEG